ncbi:MAG: aminotransferase class V-fold PLP-dependent enzyme [Ktedonobacterales bacterium]|nr:aminotransferase class V-fold PLP-dependent enzyme [Ktedonobacterales bacterium]
MTPNPWRADFPAISDHSTCMYFDNAATTQMPHAVITACHATVTAGRASVGRGSHIWGERATKQYADARATVAAFLGAASPDEVIFTSGATASLNLVALSWGMANLRDGDEIIVGRHDHKSTVLPWRRLQATLQERGIHLIFHELDSVGTGDYNVHQARELVNERTRLLVLTHVHNVFGVETAVRRIRRAIGPAPRILLDASQSVGHIPVDVGDLGVDFLAFSGHKLFADTGIGVLWVRAGQHDEVHPIFVGGDGSDPGASLPARLEVGTPNLLGALSLAAAITYVQGIGVAAIKGYLTDLTFTLIDALRGLPGIEFLPGAAWITCREACGIVAFRVPGYDATTLGDCMSERGIFVRTGNHCLPGHEWDDSLRVSMHLYNTYDEIARFIAELCTILAR